MEKKEIGVYYSGSGVKTLRGFGVLFIVIGILTLLIAVIGLIVYAENVDRLYGESDAANGMALWSSMIPISVFSYIGGAVCFGLSGIAKTALYKRTILETEYNFIDQ